MLPAGNRLRTSVTFSEVTRRGRRQGSPTVVVHCLARESGVPRVGLIVGRNVGNAVVRNRVKRRLRESMRGRLEGLGPRDLVLRALPKAGSASWTELDGDVARCLQRVEVGP